MIPTLRLALLVAAGAIPLAAGLRWPALLPLGVAYHVAVAAAAVWDLVTQPAEPLEVAREVEDVLSVGTPNRVRVRLRNRTARPLGLVVRDLAPFEFRVDRERLVLAVGAHQTAELTYHVTPPARGRYQFGNVFVRVRSRLGLWARTVEFAAARPVKVYPNLQDVRRYDLLARRGRLVEAGLRSTRRYGIGTEFEALREGLPDDSFRRINWKATARRGKLIANEYDVERSQTVLLVFDTGRLMSGEIRDPDAAGSGITKLDAALNTGLMAARVAAAHDDRVGMLAFSYAVHAYVAPRRGPGQFLHLLEALYAVEPDLGEPDYGLAVHHLSQRLRRRSLVLAFTDLIDPAVSSRLLGHLAVLARKHLVMFVTIADPVTAAMAEAVPASVGAAYEKAAAARALGGRAEALRYLARQGVVVVDRPPQELTLGVINAYLAVKAKGLV